MTFNKKDLVDCVIDEVHFMNRRKRKGQQFLFPELDYTPLTRKRATELVNSTLEIIKKALERGDYVRIRGFGSFYTHFKWARRKYNPRTREPIIVNSRRYVKFRTSLRLKRLINP
ncbi:MAG: HU family DNA-binding protein [Thermodesulfobacteriota bacterium]